jgi:hypothetical protein
MTQEEKERTTMIKSGIYRWNGANDGIDHLYEVIGVALDTVHKEGEVRDAQNHVTQFMETVVYRATYKIDEPQLTDQFGQFPMFTRTLKSFYEVIDLPSGGKGPRFSYVGPVLADQPASD